MEEEEETTEQPPESPSNIFKPLLFAAIGLIVLSNIAWGAYLVLQNGDGEESDEVASSEEPTNGAMMGPMVGIEPLVVNLNEPGAPRFLRLSVTMELRDEADLQRLTEREIPLRDMMIRHISNLDAERLQSAHDKDRLQLEILKISEELFSEPIIREVYFTEFMIQ